MKNNNVVKTLYLKIVVVFIFLLFNLNIKAQTNTFIKSSMLRVKIDKTFPRIIEYTWNKDNSKISGQKNKISYIKINGVPQKPLKVEFKLKDNKAIYKLKFPRSYIDFEISVKKNIVYFRVTKIKDSAWGFIRTIEIPNHNLLTINSNEKNSAFATSIVSLTSRINQTPDEFYLLKDKKIDELPVSRSYVFVNNDKLSATIYNNVIRDNDRFKVYTFKENGTKYFGVSNGIWTYRVIEKEIVELPYAKIVISKDKNKDGKTDWQDAAIAYRAIMNNPFGSDKIKKNIHTSIAMNFASLAQHPFLRVLDNVKKVWLYTDGLGQSIQFKGYQSEGHDSAHPDYGGNVNKRAGGAKDLKYVSDNFKNWNASAGVHINVTEFYPEAKNYRDELLTGKNGWAWLDQSVYADKRYDIISGSLYKRLDELKAEIPNLSWLYVDVYFGDGWDGWKLYTKMNSLGFAAYTEFPGVIERAAVWYHTANEYPKSGLNSKINRFIHNHLKDTWDKNKLLKGSRNLGFMGWHAEHNLYASIKNIFVNNLPTKYMQHFEIINWEDNKITFTDNVSVEENSGKIQLKKDNKLIAQWNYKVDNKKKSAYTGRIAENYINNIIFIPWSPLKEDKIYHWNEKGGSTNWDLPNSWKGVKEVKLYRLCDTGRIFIKNIPIEKNQITINAKADTPYVIYKSKPKDYPEMNWGEGGLVKEPGFDSKKFTNWKKSNKKDKTRIINDKNGFSRLEFSGSKAAYVSQEIKGLKVGQTYSASVWVEIKGKRDSYLKVVTEDENIIKIKKTDIPNYSYSSDKFNSNYQRIRTFFTIKGKKTSAKIIIGVDKGNKKSKVRFDDVRIVKAPKPKSDKYFFEDFEWTDEGWGPFIHAYKDDTQTHLSERHGDYTKDVINGHFSLKIKSIKQWTKYTGLVYRSTPALLPLKAKKKYKLSFKYLQTNQKQFSVVIAHGGKFNKKKAKLIPIKGNKGNFEYTFKTKNKEDYYIGIYKNNTTNGIFVIDDFSVEIIK